MEEINIITPKREIKVQKKYIKKNGVESIKTYDQRKYNEAFYNKHKEEINKKHLCECSAHYIKSNLSKHKKSKYHLLYLKLTSNEL
jgi:hypothetical protein